MAPSLICSVQSKGVAKEIGYTAEGVPVVRLQSVGWVLAKPASEFKVGDRIAYNYGYSGKVLSVETRGQSTYMTTEEHGKIYNVRKGKDTLVPFWK